MNTKTKTIIGILIVAIGAGVFSVTKIQGQGNPHQQLIEKQIVILVFGSFGGGPYGNLYGMYVVHVSRSSNAPVIAAPPWHNPPEKWARPAQALADLLNQGFRIVRIEDRKFTLVKEVFASDDIKTQGNPHQQQTQKQVVIFDLTFHSGSTPNSAGVYGSYVMNSSSSSNAPVIAQYWYNPSQNWVPEAQALADLLTKGFQIVHVEHDTYTLVKE